MLQMSNQRQKKFQFIELLEEHLLQSQSSPFCEIIFFPMIYVSSRNQPS